EDSDSLREEIDIFTGTDDLMPPGIESDDYDLEGDIHFLEELLGNDSIPLPKNKSSNFDHHDDPSFPRPPPEPPDVDVFFDFKPNSKELISAVMNNIDELNEDKCFDPKGGEIDVFANIKDDDNFPFIFVIQNFLLYPTYPEDTRLVVPNDATFREALLTEAHSSPFSVHPGSTKMYHDLKQSRLSTSGLVACYSSEIFRFGNGTKYPWTLLQEWLEAFCSAEVKEKTCVDFGREKGIAGIVVQTIRDREWQKHLPRVI
nr:putative reverse transcriptase domain-containing protein [Tanacetum cinerariifolium]